MTGPAEQGSALAEALVSLALTGMILAAVLPAVLQARRMGHAAGRRAQLGDSGRLSGWRLAGDLRRAGFGLGGRLPAITLENGGNEILIRYLEGGFNGGQALTATLRSGEDLLHVAATDGVKIGDTCLLADRLGGFHFLEVAAVDRNERTLQATAPVPRPFLPGAGARVQRVVQRRWWVEGDGLRRDSQPAVEPVVELSLSSWEPALTAQAAAWAVGSGTVELPPEEPGLLAVRLLLGGAPPAGGPRQGTATPGLAMSWLVRAVNMDPLMPAGSSLP